MDVQPTRPTDARAPCLRPPGLAVSWLSRALRVALWLLPRARRNPRRAGRPGSKTELPAAQRRQPLPQHRLNLSRRLLQGQPPRRCRRAADATAAPQSLFDHLGYDEFREVVDWLSGEDLRLHDSGVINSPHSGLIEVDESLTRNAALQSAFAFLEPGDLGTVVAAFLCGRGPRVCRAQRRRPRAGRWSTESAARGD